MYMLGDRDIARDAVSDTFMKLWETDDFFDGRDVDSILFVSLRNRCLDMLRHISVRSDYVNRMMMLARDGHESDAGEIDDRISRVKELIDRFPARTRFVFEQCYMEEKSYKEVAELMGITPSGVKQHIVKGLAILRKCFNNNSHDEDARSKP